MFHNRQNEDNFARYPNQSQGIVLCDSDDWSQNQYAQDQKDITIIKQSQNQNFNNKDKHQQNDNQVNQHKNFNLNQKKDLQKIQLKSQKVDRLQSKQEQKQQGQKQGHKYNAIRKQQRLNWKGKPIRSKKPLKYYQNQNKPYASNRKYQKPSIKRENLYYKSQNQFKNVQVHKIQKESIIQEQVLVSHKDQGLNQNVQSNQISNKMWEKIQKGIQQKLQNKYQVILEQNRQIINNQKIIMEYFKMNAKDPQQQHNIKKYQKL